MSFLALTPGENTTLIQHGATVGLSDAMRQGPYEKVTKALAPLPGTVIATTCENVPPTGWMMKLVRSVIIGVGCMAMAIGVCAGTVHDFRPPTSEIPQRFYDP